MQQQTRASQVAKHCLLQQQMCATQQAKHCLPLRQTSATNPTVQGDLKSPIPRMVTTKLNPSAKPTELGDLLLLILAMIFKIPCTVHTQLKSTQ
jgi:hypothetical protein